MSLTLVIGSMVGLFDRNTYGNNSGHTALTKMPICSKCTTLNILPSVVSHFVHMYHTQHIRCGGQTWG